MIPASVASFVSSLFTLLILLGLYNVSRDISRSMRYYRLCTWTCLFALITDTVFYAVNSRPELDVWSQVITFLSYGLNDILIVSYALYIHSIAEKDPGRSRGVILAVILLSCADFLVCAIGFLSGKIFQHADFFVASGPWAGFWALLPTSAIIILVIYIIRKRKELGLIYTIALCSWFFFLLISSALAYIIPHFQVYYVASALGLMMNYVFIQSRIFAEANIRAQTYNLLSIQDFLTGLKNRRGFHESANLLKPDEEIGILFFDLNGLKYINDHNGHDAGDRFVRKMADLLREHFADGEIFRMSGDEFIVILKLSDDHSFEDRTAQFKNVLRGNGWMAACGSAKGKASALDDLTQQAENGMYADKALYYEETGRDRRI